MGQSTDAILFWGYCWDEEMEKPWDPQGEDESEEDWEERYARLAGEPEPKAEYPSDGDTSANAEAIRNAYSKHWETKRKLVKAAGISIYSHCSGTCPMPYIAVEESRLCASRGTPEKVGDLSVGADWEQRLREFCHLMGITPPPRQKPRWWLVSDWS